MNDWIFNGVNGEFIKVNQDGSAIAYNPRWDDELLNGEISLTDRLKGLNGIEFIQRLRSDKWKDGNNAI